MFLAMCTQDKRIVCTNAKTIKSIALLYYI